MWWGMVGVVGDGGREIFNIFAISLQLFKKITTFHNGLFIMRYHNVLNQFPTLRAVQKLSE